MIVALTKGAMVEVVGSNQSTDNSEGRANRIWQLLL